MCCKYFLVIKKKGGEGCTLNAILIHFDLVYYLLLLVYYLLPHCGKWLPPVNVSKCLFSQKNLEKVTS